MVPQLMDNDRLVEQVIAWGVLIAVALGAWLSFDNIPFANEVVVYQGWCPTTRTEAGVCKAGEESVNPITYKASQATQSVVYWFKDQAPTHMTNCAVRDAKNWSCNQGEGLYSTVMIDGKLSQTSTSRFGVVSPFYQVSKFRWYWLWLHK